MSKIRYALIGCGRIAVNHMKAAVNNKLEIVAVCDLLPEKLEKMAAQYPGVRTYTDFTAMLQNPDIDIVSISTWFINQKWHRICGMCTNSAWSRMVGENCNSNRLIKLFCCSNNWGQYTLV